MTRPMSSPEKQTCPDCSGLGKREAGFKVEVCSTCNGTGQVPEASAAKDVCPDCHGDKFGKPNEAGVVMPCLLCNGTGAFKGRKIALTAWQTPDGVLHTLDEQPKHHLKTSMTGIGKIGTWCDCSIGHDHPAKPIETDSELDRIEEAFNQGRTADACNMIEALLAQREAAARIQELEELYELAQAMGDNEYSRGFAGEIEARLKALRETPAT